MLDSYNYLYRRQQNESLQEVEPTRSPASVATASTVENLHEIDDTHTPYTEGDERNFVSLHAKDFSITGGFEGEDEGEDDPFGSSSGSESSSEDSSFYGDEKGKASQDAHKASSGSGRPPSSSKKYKTPVLDAFGEDLTRAALEGKNDPMIGRENELQRLMHVLCRRKKNNPVLIGDPGVGKSAIVEGLAQRIVENKVPLALMDKRIIRLDTALMVAGTKYRGEFEERLKGIMKELAAYPNIIIFIDEIHTIVGTGSTENSLDMSNMLKPALARGEIKCIGATTLSEYAKTIEKDGALERRFQKVLVSQNNTEETLEILRKIKGQYESFHGVEYTDEALKVAVELTDRYISDRFFPDKAIDVIDEAGAGASLQKTVPVEEIDKIKAEADSYKEKRYEAVKNLDYELAASWRDKERESRGKLNKLMESAKENRQRIPVDSEQVAAVVARITGVPLERLAKSETAKLRDLDKTLAKEVIGQDEAIQTIAKAIQRNRLGLRNEKRPIGSFLFLGPTGVGKTFLVKKLTEQLFGDEDALIRIDMSEFSEKFTVSRLVGAPPGYVGYEEGGQLTEKVRHRPYSVLLLDEIEKAHPEVFNLLLQLLDEGALTDSFGRRVNFKNTVIIMTGNIGSRRLSEFGTSMGYRAEADPAEEQKKAKGIIDKELKKTFSPEFLNRLDAVVHFNSLSKESIRTIVDNQLQTIAEKIAKQGYNISVDSAVSHYLADKGYDPLYGARPVARTLQNEIQDRITDLILEEAVKEGDTIVFTLKEGAIKTSVKRGKSQKDTPVEAITNNA